MATIISLVAFRGQIMTVKAHPGLCMSIIGGIYGNIVVTN